MTDDLSDWFDRLDVTTIHYLATKGTALAGEIYTTIVGNLADNPELRHLDNGTPVARMRVANTPRRFNRDSDKFEDQAPTWVNVTAWRNLATNAAHTFKKGDRVIAYGVLENREYEDKEGVKRTSLDMTVEALGPDLTWVTATMVKADGKERKKAEPKPDAFESAKPAQPATAQATPAAAAPSADDDW